MRSIGSTLVDNLDRFLGRAIDDRFGEPVNDSSEGEAEFANPQTVSQPVNQSQFPSGEPRNQEISLLRNLPTYILLGVAALLVLILLMMRRG